MWYDVAVIYTVRHEATVPVQWEPDMTDERFEELVKAAVALDYFEEKGEIIHEEEITIERTEVGV